MNVIAEIIVNRDVSILMDPFIVVATLDTDFKLIMFLVQVRAFGFY